MQKVFLVFLFAVYVLGDHPEVCPNGKVYDNCGPVCPLTCIQPNNQSCIQMCNPGCFCPEGLLQDGARCVHANECPRNPEDCSTAHCPQPPCPENEWFKPIGQCCPVCRPDVRCPSGGRPFDNTDCRSKACPFGHDCQTDHTGLFAICCPRACGNGKVWGCRSQCAPKCGVQTPELCPFVCVYGCQCPGGTILDPVTDQCVTTCPGNCPACEVGTECDEISKNCIPVSCAAVNACPKDKRCVPEPSRGCAHEPCRKFDCIDRPSCNSIICPAGTQCNPHTLACTAVTCDAHYACPPTKACLPASRNCPEDIPCPQFNCIDRWCPHCPPPCASGATPQRGHFPHAPDCQGDERCAMVAVGDPLRCRCPEFQCVKRIGCSPRLICPPVPPHCYRRYNTDLSGCLECGKIVCP